MESQNSSSEMDSDGENGQEATSKSTPMKLLSPGQIKTESLKGNYTSFQPSLFSSPKPMSQPESDTRERGKPKGVSQMNIVLNIKNIPRNVSLPPPPQLHQAHPQYLKLLRQTPPHLDNCHPSVIL